MVTQCQAQIQLSADWNMRLHWVCFNKLFHWLVHLRHPLDQSKTKPVLVKRIFLSSYWLIITFTFVQIGCCDKFAHSSDTQSKRASFVPKRGTNNSLEYFSSLLHCYHTYWHLPYKLFTSKENKNNYFKWMQLLPMLNSNSSLTIVFFERSNSFWKN